MSTLPKPSTAMSDPRTWPPVWGAARPCGGVFLPRAVYFTGDIDGHDAAWVGSAEAVFAEPLLTAR